MRAAKQDFSEKRAGKNVDMQKSGSSKKKKRT
jgi:hypothetical protein